jgi:glycosyltransferase involved in cell wall biosynthesis
VKVLYVLKRYPRLSETFVVRELLGVEAERVVVGIDSLMPAEEGPRHPEVSRVRGTVRYLPPKPRPTDGAMLMLQAHLLLRHPYRWFGEVIPVLRKGDSPRKERWRRFLHAGLVADRARRDGFDRIHAHFATAASEVAVIAGKLAGIPVSVTAHAKDIFQQDNSVHVASRLQRVDDVVTISSFNQAHLQSLLPGRTIHHVPNGVNLGPAHGGTHGGPLLCVSRLVKKKGIDTLLEAVALLAADRPDLRLEVVGSGPLAESLKELAQRLKISDRVTFFGALPSTAVDAAYERCAVVVLPCRITQDGDRDGLPTVLVEALARSVPVISTSVVGIPELVRHGETGLLVEPDDPVALAAAIDKLTSDPALAHDLGSHGRQLVAASYDPTDAAKKLISVWKGQP